VLVWPLDELGARLTDAPSRVIEIWNHAGEQWARLDIGDGYNVPAARLARATPGEMSA